MNEPGLDGVFESLSSTWEAALNEKRQHDAIIDGVLGYLFFHGKDNPTYEYAALICVRKAIDDALAQVVPEQQANQPQHSCSFCGRGEPAVRLAAGAHGFICDGCVSQLGEVFKQQNVQAK